MSLEPALRELATEQLCAACSHIDEMGTLDALRAINEQDHEVPRAVSKVLPQIAELVDAIVERLGNGGRLVYVGAGTSGRIGILDASECPPTFGVDAEKVQGLLAGGKDAFWRAVEGAEDDREGARRDLDELNVGPLDSVVGIAASGRTPYVIGALDHARGMGALTGSVSCVSPAELSLHSDYAIECVTGPEPICGSTRMKAGTAQKMILNMISTESMVKLGKVYGNLMVDVRPTNHKLRDRAERIVVASTGCGVKRARAALGASGDDVKIAICMVLLNAGAEECSKALSDHRGNISATIRDLKK